jgi:hypothetical protein
MLETLVLFKLKMLFIKLAMLWNVNKFVHIMFLNFFVKDKTT